MMTIALMTGGSVAPQQVIRIGRSPAFVVKREPVQQRLDGFRYETKGATDVGLNIGSVIGRTRCYHRRSSLLGCIASAASLACSRFDTL